MKKKFLSVIIMTFLCVVLLVPTVAYADDVVAQENEITTEETAPVRETTTGVVETETTIVESTTAMATVEQKNITKSATILIRKVDSQSSELLGGAKFKIYNDIGTVVKSGTTSADGTFSFTLQYGTYYYEETVSPNGYDLTDKGKHKFVVDGKNTDIVITVADEKLPSTVKVHTGVTIEEYAFVGSVVILLISFAVLIHKRKKASE